MSEILMYFHEICLHVSFQIIFSFHHVNYSQSKFVELYPVFITSFLSVKGYMIPKNFSSIFLVCNKAIMIR